jgi:hypothetical protein
MLLSMRYIALLAALLSLALMACGDDDVSVPDELASVCTQGEEAAIDTIEVRSPEPGDKVTSPLAISAVLTVDESLIHIALVDADGAHIADYPGRPDVGEGVSFAQSVPFGVEEETAACLWVSHSSLEDPADAIRIPITLAPGGVR